MFQGIQQVQQNTPCYQSSYRHPSLKKKQESNQRPNFGSHLGNLLSFKLIIRLKSLESRLDGFKRKTFQNDIWNLGPRTIFMAKRGLSRMALYRKRAHLKSLPGLKKNFKKKTFIVSDHCRFSPWNMSFLFMKTLVLHKFTPSILATSILPIIFSTSGWISSRNPSHRRVCRVGISDQGLGSPPWDISKMHHVEVVYCLQ